MKHLKAQLADLLFKLIRPRYWMQNEPTNWEFDKHLSEALDKYGVIVINRHQARVGNAEIWISNYPYSFGHIFSKNYERSQTRLPSARTREKLYRLIKPQLPKPEKYKYKNPWIEYSK